MSNNHFTAHPGFYNQPIRLTTEEQAQPLEVLREFFQNCHLADVRQTVWNMVETGLAADYSLFDTANDRGHLLWFYYAVERLLEAGLLLCREGVYVKAKSPGRPDGSPQPIWPTKADLEDEIRHLKIENVLQENELIHLRFFKEHGRMMTDPEPASPGTDGEVG